MEIPQLRIRNFSSYDVVPVVQPFIYRVIYELEATESYRDKKQSINQELNCRKFNEKGSETALSNEKRRKKTS